MVLEYSNDDLKLNDFKNKNDIFINAEYLCHSNDLIVASLKRGNDVAQLGNGDIIVSEVKTINTKYSWDSKKGKLVKISQY